jgi:carbohydrate kinase (thermoresistant glucokinase family)
VVTCSALRRAYRDLLREGRPAVRFLHVTVPTETIADRLEHRAGHYMPPSLLPSQLATLEPPEPDEPAVVVDQLAVLVWDAYAQGRGDVIPELLVAARRALG